MCLKSVASLLSPLDNQMEADRDSEIAFILVATFPYLAPGGFRALLIGPTLDGLLGSLSTLTATINAYISDVTPDGSRAAVFARLTGTMMLGFATGPVLGSFVIKWTGNMWVTLLQVCDYSCLAE